MDFWRHISRKWRKTSATAQLELTDAYRRVFAGRASLEDAEVVLADMVNASGYYSVSGPNVSDTERAFADGKRAVIARLLAFLQLPDSVRAQLERAARAEAAADAEADYETAQLGTR